MKAGEVYINTETGSLYLITQAGDTYAALSLSNPPCTFAGWKINIANVFEGQAHFQIHGHSSALIVPIPEVRPGQLWREKHTGTVYYVVVIQGEYLAIHFGDGYSSLVGSDRDNLFKPSYNYEYLCATHNIVDRLDYFKEN